MLVFTNRDYTPYCTLLYSISRANEISSQQQLQSINSVNSSYSCAKLLVGEACRKVFHERWNSWPSVLQKLESLLRAIRSAFYCIFKENHTLLWFLKSLHKNPRIKKLESIHGQHFIERKNEGRIPVKKMESEDSTLCPETLTFHLRSSLVRTFDPTTNPNKLRIQALITV